MPGTRTKRNYSYFKVSDILQAVDEGKMLPGPVAASDPQFPVSKSQRKAGEGNVFTTQHNKSCPLINEQMGDSWLLAADKYTLPAWESSAGKPYNR